MKKIKYYIVYFIAIILINAFFIGVLYYFYDTLLDYFTKISLFARTHKEDKEDENKL